MGGRGAADVAGGAKVVRWMGDFKGLRADGDLGATTGLPVREDPERAGGTARPGRGDTESRKPLQK
jgi:hypothetical protein